MYNCPQCGTPMESKGEIGDESSYQNGSAVFYQCPKCKNIELHARQSTHWFRTDYP